MSLFIVKFAKNSHLYSSICLIFLKNFLKQNWTSFNTIFWPQWKDRKNSYRIRQVLSFFSNLTSIILVENSVKGIKVTAIAKKIKFKAVWGELQPENGIQRIPVTKYRKLTLVFMWSGTRLEKFNSGFSRNFY